MLSRPRTVSALKDLIVVGVLWAVYTQIMMVSSPILAGYALEIGVSGDNIGTLVSIAFLTCLFQPVGLVVARRFRNKKLFIIAAGIGETAVMPLCVLVPFLFTREHAFAGLVIFSAVALCSVNMIISHLSAWWSDIVPAEIRGRFTAKRLIIMAVVAAIALQLAGALLDSLSDRRLLAFRILLAVALVTGVGGYLWLTRVPYPGASKRETRSMWLKARLAIRNRNLRRCVACFGVIQAAYYVALPFFNVFMIKQMGLPYWKIAVITNLALASTILSYRISGPIIDRLGSAFVVQILIVPLAASAWLWAFVRGGNATLAAAAMALGTFSFSGIVIASMALFYGITPPGDRKPVFMSVWLVGVNSCVALGSFVGGRLLKALPESIDLAGIPLTPYQCVFALSGVLLVLASPLARILPGTDDVTGATVSAWLRRGNIFSFAYNYLWFSVARSRQTRTKRLRGMARSRSPAAVEPLLEAMDDASAEVRSHAALGLGEVRDERALDRLIETARDDESDVREAALVGLGKSGSTAAYDILVESLDDDEASIANSAIHALAQIGGPRARDALRHRLAAPFDRRTFPTLIDGLAQLGDLDVVETAVVALDLFRSPAVRLRILQAVSQIVGAGRTFAGLLAADPLHRTEIEMRLLQRLRGQLRRQKKIDADTHDLVSEALVSLSDCVENENPERLRHAAKTLALGVLARERELAARFRHDARVLSACAYAVRAYLQLDSPPNHPLEQTAILETLIIRQIRYLLGLPKPS